uniref:(northern house mosquito) hypothetical protein n=1 Tax=Culex pipiens TaxID=7175 RepID=A0A8D8BDQ1_CULPI
MGCCVWAVACAIRGCRTQPSTSGYCRSTTRWCRTWSDAFTKRTCMLARWHCWRQFVGNSGYPTLVRWYARSHGAACSVSRSVPRQPSSLWETCQRVAATELQRFRRLAWTSRARSSSSKLDGKRPRSRVTCACSCAW